jgi:small subunit ribosomal protein S2
MANVNYKELLEAGCHFGHLTRKWNPNMAPYIFMEKNGIHIIDLNKTVAKLEEASSALNQIAKSGKKILFVATKKQAKDLTAQKVEQINMPFITERWSVGMLTNFATVRKAVRKLNSLEKMEKDGTFEKISKRERLTKSRQRDKLNKTIGSISDLNRLPAALFIVDIHKEHIAVAEAKKLGIPTFAIVDTNSNPNEVDFAIPANDDSSASVEKILEIVCASVAEGLEERKATKEAAKKTEKVTDEKEA